MESNPTSSRSFAASYVSNSRFHRSFTIEPTPAHGPLNVTYGDYGREPDANGTTPTLLFIPGMFSSRYIGICLHAIADKCGVRVLVVDRPGMGNSTDVPLAQRMSTWIETVPRLLAHLDIQHVSLASHSAGTMYLFNTLYHCRDILYPEKPMATVLAPFVDPAKSGMTSLKIAQYIPAPVFKLWHHIPRLFLANDASATATSGEMIAKFSASFPSKSGDDQAKNSLYIAQNYGLDIDQQKEIDSLMMQGMFKEDTVGANSEALQCLRKEPNTWDKCEDYEVFVRELVELERGREGPPLKVQALFAESDSMSGKKGQAYFERCWHQMNDGDSEGAIEFDSRVVSGTDHDSLVPSAEVWESIFKKMQRAEDNI
ncbi:hypothetical protein LCP9604111_6121 [Penicillium roqueforti]|uniref:uncharacterized protein n=1 Tax=Penicillium roqueforti TaxID=5082 RepID=UPI001909104D|nr:uncharacterized protein LCP9604111_6121 [Penicillium roqueforti]KAF9247422.1 hypothetical protein LCP9604111_6121 [Penicillium roqueforti]KAI3164083.1 hypothetical protein DTO039G3_7854 [Penicillium roqueforti]